MINKLRDLLRASTPGPWVADYSPAHDNLGNYNIAVQQKGEMVWPAEFCNTKTDADLIVEMRNQLPALLDRLEKLEETVTTGKQLTRERVMQVMEAFCREKDAQDMCDLLFGVEE